MREIGVFVGSIRKRKLWATAGYLSMAIFTGCSLLQHKVDKNDVCYNERTELLGADSYYARSVLEGIITGAVVGAVTGAAIGALGAAAGGGNVGKSAGMGAAAGGLTGAITGGVAAYYEAKQKNAADAQALAGSIRDDIFKENAEISRVSIAFAHLRDCRFANAEKIKSQYRSGMITREQATNKLAELKKLFDEDISIAEKYGTKMSDNIKTFDYAANKIMEDDPEAKRIFAKYRKDMAAYEKAMAAYERSCGKNPKKCSSKSPKKSSSRKAAHSKSTSAKRMPVKPVISKPNPKAEAAIAITEATQYKSKHDDTLAQSKSIETARIFLLEASSKPEEPSGWLPPEYLMPENMVCGR